jgi:FAD:protein FMN transferase
MSVGDLVTHESRIRFSAMGTWCELIVTDGASLLADAESMVAELERRWSRFLPGSDICRINGAEGESVSVHWTTRDVLLLAKDGWVRTEGRFDPTVGAAMNSLGYAQSFEFVENGVAMIPSAPTKSPGSSGCGGIEIDVETCAVRVPSGTSVDLGGIAKGRTADLIARALIEKGAKGACVNIGGDVVALGEPPIGDAWTVAVANPSDTATNLLRVRLRDAAIAMSSPTIRQWVTQTPGGVSGVAHHIVDPVTSKPALTDVAAVAVIAGAGWWADLLTKSLMTTTANTALETLSRVGSGAHGLVIDSDGKTLLSEGFLPFVVQDVQGVDVPDRSEVQHNRK